MGSEFLTRNTADFLIRHIWETPMEQAAMPTGKVSGLKHTKQYSLMLAPSERGAVALESSSPLSATQAVGKTWLHLGRSRGLSARPRMNLTQAEKNQALSYEKLICDFMRYFCVYLGGKHKVCA